MVLASKQYSVSIDVRNPVNFCADKEKHVLTHLQRTYEGKCYGGAYIVEITKVDKISACRVVKNNLSASGNVDVAFTAAVVVYGQWDILVGVEIAERDHMVVGFLRDAPVETVVALLPTDMVQTISIGQVVAIRVKTVLYPPFQSQMTVAGVVLTCDQRTPVYRLQTAIEPSAAQALLPLVERVENELDRRAELMSDHRESLWFFESLLYSYALPDSDDREPRVVETEHASAWVGPGGAELPPLATEINLLEFVKNAAQASGSTNARGLWCRDFAIRRSAPLVARAPEEKAPEGWDRPLVERPAIALAAFLNNVYNFLAAVRGMVEGYSTPEEVARHENVWAAMRRVQKQIA